MNKALLLFLSTLFLTSEALSQDPGRFTEEVQEIIKSKENYPKEDLIVFTGSSSIRLWTDFKSYFPNHNVINTGFGGSQTSDLYHFKKELITDFKPQQVFIYEGDNDLNAGKSGFEIIADLSMLVKELILEDGVEEVVIISPKPSIARWKLKTAYEKLNAALEEVCNLWDNVKFVDVWKPMLNLDGSLKKDIFIEDGLHMNRKGYDIWIEQIRPFLFKQ